MISSKVINAASAGLAAGGASRSNTAGICLHVGGKKYGGWKTARVTHGIETIAGGFSLTVSDRWIDKEQEWPIRQGDECWISINGTTVITGYVDRRDMSYDRNGFEVSVAGRDKAAALVDCSVLLDHWEFKGLSLLEFVAKVANAVGVGVSLLRPEPGFVLPAPPPKFPVDPGATGFEVVERACRTAGMLPISDGSGGILLTRAGSSRVATPLIEGKNILRADSGFDHTNRFHRYVVLAQFAGTDEAHGRVQSTRGEAVDEGVTRKSRVLVIRPDESLTTAQAKVRAQWEATTRAARSTEFVVQVQGWQQGNGELWPINSLVSVCSPRMGLGTFSDSTSKRVEKFVELLVTAATYEVSKDQGSTTTLTLRHPSAFTPMPTLDKRTEGKHAPWTEIARGV